ncbi:MAG TPA: hypothetical protein EYP14_11495 [Planctomycetaceae bacterium]|nr:hypothetical protein [Planctomycetaceae bacterium]
MVGLAERLLRETEPAAALIGASWLCGTQQSERAKAVLEQLAAGPMSHVAALARMQLWRWELDRADQEHLAQWRRTVESLPAELRAGGYFLIGLVHYHAGSYDQAALALLWPALVLRSNLELSREALWMAAKAELEAGHRPAAAALLAEYLERYPAGPAAAEARRHLDRLSAGQ